MKPAILGGEPIRSKSLPYAKQYIDDDDLNAVNEVLEKAEELAEKEMELVTGGVNIPGLF